MNISAKTRYITALTFHYYCKTADTWTFAFYLNGNSNLILEQQRNLREIINGNRLLRHARVVVYCDRGQGAGPPLMYSWKGARIFHVQGSAHDILSQPIIPGLPSSVEEARFRERVLKNIRPRERDMFLRYYTPRENRFHVHTKDLTAEDRNAMVSILHKTGYLLPEETATRDSLSPETMAGFFSYVRDSYISEHYAFFIAGHGQGWFPDMIERNSSGNPAGIRHTPHFNIMDIKKALVCNEPDILCLDMCLMGDMETVYQLRKSARYLLVSQGSMPAGGQDYRYLLELIRRKAPCRPEDTAQVIFESYAHALEKSRLHSTVSLVRTGSELESFVRIFMEKMSDARIQKTVYDREKDLVRLPRWSSTSSTMIDMASLTAVINSISHHEVLNDRAFILKRFTTGRRTTGLSLCYPQEKREFQLLKDEYAGLDFNRESGESWMRHIEGRYF